MNNFYFFRGVSVLALFVLSGSLVHAAAFPDVPRDHPNSDAIEYVQANGIVSGYADGTYKPERMIDRAEFTKIIIGARYSPAVIDQCIAENIPENSTYVFFPDVPRDAWFAKYICVARAHNIINGYPEGIFQPGATISFIESAKVIVNGFGYPVGADAVWYKPFVDELAEKNAIPTTISDFTYQLHRGEMAEVIYRLSTDLTTKPSTNYERLANMLTLKVYFQTLQNNADLIDCGKVSVVNRTILNTRSTALAALEQLFSGPTTQEKERGLLDFSITEQTASNLKRIFIKNGVAYLDWKDLRIVIPSVGSSCGSVGFLKPIEATLMQFPTVTKVIHAIDGQPSVFYNWIQMGCSSENNNCDATPYQIPSLPTTCVDTVGGTPVITSLSHYSGMAGTKLEIHGCNFSGFEGDTNAWIKNSAGAQGVLYGESGSTSKLIRTTLKSPLCKTDTSYTGLPCDNWFLLTPGSYSISVMPWGRSSNSIYFTLLPVSNSGITGQVLLGPTCPIMSNPPNSSCGDNPYKTTIEITEIKSVRKNTYTTVTDVNGRYTMMLPPGAYSVHPVGGNPFPTCETKNITVSSGIIENIDLLCDTGIR